MKVSTLWSFCTDMAASPTTREADALTFVEPLVALAVFCTDVPDAIAVVICSSIHTVPDFV
jgi:hypothetical protein